MNRSSMSSYTAVLVLAIMIGLVAVSAAAQMAPGSGRMMGPFYNAGTEVTVTGTVSEVQQIAGPTAGTAGTTWTRCPRGWTGTHLLVKTDAGDLMVHVGPSAYLANKNFSIAAGDKIKILGSKVQYQGSEFLIAREVTKGDQVLTLPDSRGFPQWSGFRRGTPMPNPNAN